MRTRSKFGINFGATAGTSQILELNSLQFKNHLVVELLWPRRERRARMIAVVELDILNLLSTNFQIRIRCRGSSSSLFGVNIVAMASTSRILALTELMEPDSESNTRFNFGINVVAMAGTSRTQLVSLLLRFLNLLFNILNRKTKLQYDFVFSSLVFHNKMLSEEK